MLQIINSVNLFNVAKYYILFIVFFLSFACSNNFVLPDLNKSFKNSSVTVKVDKLIVSTGKVTRQWKVTESGLKTVSLRDEVQDKEWIYNDKVTNSDWYIKDVTKGIAEITNVSANTGNDEGFTSEYPL